MSHATCSALLGFMTRLPWVLEVPVQGQSLDRVPLHIYVADRATVDRVLRIKQKMFPAARIRPATEQERMCVLTHQLPHTDLDPGCRKWWFATEDNGESSGQVHQNTSLAQILSWAESLADGHRHIYFRPARTTEVQAANKEGAMPESQKLTTCM